MQYRKHNGYTISEIGIGCYALSGAYGPKDVQAYKQMLRRAYGMGVNFFDTADAYGNAEQILGEVVKAYRNRVYIATKVGVKEGIKPNLSREHVKLACEESLQKLQMEYIDLYQIHFDDPNTPVEETVGALEELVKAGKVRHYGIGHLPFERAKAYFKAGDLFSVLMELSVVSREAQEKMLPLCREYDASAIAFSVTGRGLLTGRFREKHEFEAGDIRRIDPLFQRERLRSGLRMVEKLTEVGREYGKTPVQVAIAWVLSQPGIVCALTGPSTVAHLAENIGGSGWRLSADVLENLETFFERENIWLKKEQRSSVRHILLNPLPQEPSQAFKDLVYVVETAILLGLVAEERVIPVFQELYGLWKKLDSDVRPQLESIQNQLCKQVVSIQ